MWRDYLSRNIENIEANKGISPNKELLLLGWFVGEVENGGIDQYLYNDAGNDFVLLKEAATAIDFKPLSGIISDIEAIFPDNSVPSDRCDRNEVIETLLEKYGDDLFDNLTTIFYNLTEPLDLHVDNYLSRWNISDL